MLKLCPSSVWWHIPLIPVIRKLRPGGSGDCSHLLLHSDAGASPHLQQNKKLVLRGLYLWVARQKVGWSFVPYLMPLPPQCGSRVVPAGAVWRGWGWGVADWPDPESRYTAGVLLTRNGGSRRIRGQDSRRPVSKRELTSKSEALVNNTV